MLTQQRAHIHMPAEARSKRLSPALWNPPRASGPSRGSRPPRASRPSRGSRRLVAALRAATRASLGSRPEGLATANGGVFLVCSTHMQSTETSVKASLPVSQHQRSLNSHLPNLPCKTVPVANHGYSPSLAIKMAALPHRPAKRRALLPWVALGANLKGSRGSQPAAALRWRATPTPNMALRAA